MVQPPNHPHERVSVETKGMSPIHVDATSAIDEDDNDSSCSEGSLVGNKELRNDFESILDDTNLSFKGNFYHSSLLMQAPNPCLQISGLGAVGLPLSERDAMSIISCLNVSSEHTVVDQDVRTTYEVEPRKISFSNSSWNAYINGPVRQEVCRSLGIETSNTSPKMELSKLLVYQQGSYFLSCKDTPKADGMFATMIVLLPSTYTGGQDHVSHADTTKIIDFAPNSHLSTALLAWYNDARHEVKPITSGYRFALSYNLIHIAPPEVPKPCLPNRDDALVGLRQVLQKWRDGTYTDLPRKPLLAYILDHKYSAFNLKQGFSTLKGADTHKVTLLGKIAEELGYMVGLASLEHMVTGPGDDDGFVGYGYHPRERYNRWYSLSEDEYMDEVVPEMMEVRESSTSISDLVDLQGNPWLSSHQSMYLPAENLVQDNPFEDEEPDDTSYEGKMGAGDVFHWYRRTVLVVAHKDDFDTIFFATGGLTYALQKLKALGVDQEDTPMTDECRRWAEKIMLKVSYLQKDQVLQMLNVAIRWKNINMFNAIVKSPACGLGEASSDMLMKALKIFSFEVVQLSFETLLARSISLTEKINFIFEVVAPAAVREEKDLISKWCTKESRKVLTSYSNPDEKKVHDIMTVIRLVGLDSVREQMLPNILKQNNTYAFLIAFVKALRNGRQGTLDRLPVQTGGVGSSSAPESEDPLANTNRLAADGSTSVDGNDEVDELIAECLTVASKQWPQMANSYTGSYGFGYGSYCFGVQTAKIDRIIEILEQALISKKMVMCKTVIGDVLSLPGTACDNFAQIYTPLIPKLKALLSSQKRDITSPPFVDLFQVLIGRYLRDVLGAKVQQSAPSLRRIGCGCTECQNLDAFILNPTSETRTFRLAQRFRTHLEVRLVTASDLCRYETIRVGCPHGLQVTKLPEVVQASSWAFRQNEALKFLSTIGPEDTIKTIMGGRYPDIGAALDGSAQFDFQDAAVAIYSAVIPAVGSADSLAAQQASIAGGSTVASLKRKSPA